MTGALNEDSFGRLGIESGHSQAHDRLTRSHLPNQKGSFAVLLVERPRNGQDAAADLGLKRGAFELSQLFAGLRIPLILSLGLIDRVHGGDDLGLEYLAPLIEKFA